MTVPSPRLTRRPVLGLALLVATVAGLGCAQLPARADNHGEDPPARAAHVTERQGGVVFSPTGEDEWLDLPANRPLTVGDRLWTDGGSRAELHLGTATLHLDGEGHLGIAALDEMAAQLVLLQGSVNARLRELAEGENFEVDTPHLAFRARAPGDFRVDVDRQGAWTRVTVRNGMAVVFGEGGQSVSLSAGQSRAFSGRALAPVQIVSTSNDALDQWAAQRNAQEDRSVTARYVPRGVVGYPLLDSHGSWVADPNHGPVWLPHAIAPDWAPYRHGRWSWVAPWGWTWVDDAPWGFAPFHYGRWALVGARWGWVPDALAPRPVYAPALVAFYGDPGGNVSVQVGGPAVGWYPLAPGEAWWPTYTATAVYLGGVNRNIDLRRWPRNHWDGHAHRSRAQALTVIRVDDFRGGRPVREAWRPVQPAQLGQWRPGIVPQRPDHGRPPVASSFRPGGDAHRRDQWDQVRRQWSAQGPGSRAEDGRRAQREDEARRRELAARQREIEARERELAARQREADARRREAEMRQREQEERRREADAHRRNDGDARRRAEAEARRQRDAESRQRAEEQARRSQEAAARQERERQDRERRQREAERQPRQPRQPGHLAPMNDAESSGILPAGIPQPQRRH